MPAPSTEDAYVDFRMQEWRITDQSRRVQTCVRRVLKELATEALLRLKDPKLEVMVLPDPDFAVWAYFPIYRNRLISRELKPKPKTRVLLVFSVAALESEPVKQFEHHLRDHLGHVLLYLRKPKANNDCPDAMKEWRMSVRDPAQKAAVQAK